jgi:NDP-sugar pyrophosphorylase family protein
MKAVILAGGKGEEMHPLTLTRPKSMMLVMNQPILERIIENLPKVVDEVFITTDYGVQAIRNHFRDSKKKLGKKVTIVEEERPLGTAGSIKVLEKELNTTFLVLQSDVVSSVDYFKMLEFHRERKAAVTMSTFRVQNPTEYGILGVDQDGRVMKFLEKPKIDQVFSTMVNAGTYVCEPSIFEEIPHHGICDFSNDVFPRLIRKGEFVAAFEFRGMWTDIGSFQNYLHAHKQLLERSMTFSIQSKSNARTIPPVLVGFGGKIGVATLGPNVCIADKVAIGKGTKIYDSIIYDNVKIGDGCIIKGSVIGSGCKIGKGVVIVDALLGDRVTVKDRTKVSSYSRIWPGKKVTKDVAEKEWLGFIG